MGRNMYSEKTGKEKPANAGFYLFKIKSEA